MFDLFRSQAKMKRIMLGAILVVVSLGMLLYLIPGGVGGGSGNIQEQVVAEVGGQKITAREVYRRIEAVFRNSQIPRNLMEVYVPQLIEAMVADRAVAYEAQRMGFTVSDEEVGRQIRSSPQFANLPPDQEEAALQQMGYTVGEFLDGERKNAVANMLNSVAAEGIVVTPQEAEALYRQANEKIKLAYILFPSDKFQSQINPTPADLQSYYDMKKNGFAVPESRSVVAVLVDQDKIAAGIQTSDAQLQAYYNSHQDQFRTGDRIKARHILLQTVGKTPDEVGKIKAKAEQLLKEVKAGGNFAELAKKNSEDPGSGANGGELGWIERDRLEKPFADAAFALNPGEISGLVTTRFGFHIIQLEEKQKAGLQPFDSVRAQIAAEMNRQLVADKMQSLADQAHAQLVKAPQNAAQIASSLGLMVVKADNITASGPIPGIGASQDLSEAIAGLGKNQVSQEIQVTPARIAIAVVTDVNPPHVPPLSQVEASVRAAYISDATAKLVQKKAQEAVDMLAKNGGDMEAVAKSMGLEVKTSEPFTKSGSLNASMGASYFGDAFNKPIGAIVGPINGSGQTAVAKVVDKTIPDMKDFAAQKASIIENLKQKKLQERALLFQDSILQKLTQEGKIKYYKDVVNQVISRYRAS